MSIEIRGSMDTAIDLNSHQDPGENIHATSRKRRYYSCLQCEYYSIDKEQLKTDICRCLQKTNGDPCDKCLIEKCQCLNEFVYNLCEECMDFIHDFDAEAMNEAPSDDIRDALYFVLHDNNIEGPYTISEIVTFYVCRKFSKNQIQIMSSSKNECWTHIEFPNNIMSEIVHECIYCKLTQEYDKTRNEIDTEEQKVCNPQKSSGVYKYLYKRLVIDALKGELKQVIIPKKEPKYKHGLLWSLGTIAVAVSTLILIAHTICTLLVALLFSWFLSLIRNCCTCIDNLFWNHNEAMHSMILFVAHSGIVIIPILLSRLMVNNVDKFAGEMQSWMVAYIWWGIMSYLTSLAYFLAEIFGSEMKLYHSVSYIMFKVIGLDFGEIDIFDAFACGHVDISKLIFEDSLKHKMVQITILFLFPSLFSLLPALVAGFTANFLWEEKFLLRCGNDVVDTGHGLCFDDADAYGCCQVLSSHDHQNSYLFIGGIGSTCVTLFGFIRISAFLMASAFPTLSTFSKRIQ